MINLRLRVSANIYKGEGKFNLCLSVFLRENILCVCGRDYCVLNACENF